MSAAPASAPSRQVRRTAHEIHRDDLALEALVFIATGNSRRHAGDAALVDDDTGLLAVADGVSTLSNGAQTAAYCVRLLNEAVSDEDSVSSAGIGEMVETINKKTFAAKISKSAAIRLGACTLAGVHLWPGGAGLTCFHVGDGMVLLRPAEGDRFTALTKPHVVERDSGFATAQKVTRLTAAIGARPTVRPDVSAHQLGDRGGLIVATDGLKDPNALAAEPWFDWGGSSDDLDRAIELLADVASDDLTVIAARWRRGG